MARGREGRAYGHRWRAQRAFQTVMAGVPGAATGGFKHARVGAARGGAKGQRIDDKGARARAVVAPWPRA